MQIVKNSEKVEKKNPGACIIYEYPLVDRDIDGAVAKINGREPVKGFEANKKCKELCYVIEGGGKLFSRDRSFDLVKGDMVLIQPNEEYYWDGKMILFISCNPKWTAQDHVFVK